MNIGIRTMKIKIRPNDSLGGFDLIDEASDQSHDGDDAKEWIATVYSRKYAELIASLLETKLPGAQ